MIAALYVATGGIYYGIDDVDPWDTARDARLYPGPHPVVAHPPCARWGQERDPMTTWRIICGDALEALAQLPAESVHCCVTSPPYWMQRCYGVEGQLGLEGTPQVYVATMVQVMAAVHRVLRSDGTLWIDMGDGYAGSWKAQGRQGKTGQLAGRTACAQRQIAQAAKRDSMAGACPEGLKPKDLIGMPWRLALALQDDGWWLRSEIIIHKPNCMPEAVRDRPTRAHEHLFLLTKSRYYYYDQDAIKEPTSGTAHPRGDGVNRKISKAAADISRAWSRKRATSPEPRQNASFSAAVTEVVETRNARTVWSIASQARSEAHFAAFPDELARRCVLAGCPEGGIVLDPFVGRGTTAIVALRWGRSAIGIDLSPEYCEMARANIIDDAPLLNPGLETHHE